MKALRFHPEAEAELVEAAIWYEEQQQGLGQRFLTCVQDALNRTLLNPELYPLVDCDVRRCLTKTFPFGILFRAGKEQIAVLAVMHLRREPGYWRSRASRPTSA